MAAINISEKSKLRLNFLLPNSKNFFAQNFVNSIADFQDQLNNQLEYKGTIAGIPVYVDPNMGDNEWQLRNHL